MGPKVFGICTGFGYVDTVGLATGCISGLTLLVVFLIYLFWKILDCGTLHANLAWQFGFQLYCLRTYFVKISTVKHYTQSWHENMVSGPFHRLFCPMHVIDCVPTIYYMAQE